MKKQILLALFFSFTYLGLNAQCNVPFPPAATCASAPVICTLDGYCTTSGGANSADQPSTFCGSVQNNQWFSFVAGSANITLDFIVGLCGGTTSGTGLQAQVYTMCGAPWTAASNCLYEISPNSTETLTMTGLTVGNVYYLMTDGFSGDMCDYSIEVTSGSTTPPTPDPAGPINGDAQFCPGASSVTYCATASFGAAFYEWTVPPGAVIVGADDGACITIDFSGIIGTTGVITATPTNGCESGAPSTFNVTQGPPPTGPDQNFILCPGEFATYGNTDYSTATNGTPFVNTDFDNAQGCPIETLVYVEVGTIEETDLDEVICQGETSSTGETSTGTYVYNLLTNYYECDSTVTLDLLVLNPTTGIFPVTDEIDCSGDPVQVSAVVTDTDPSITYIWSGPCFTQNLPGTPTIEVTCGGVYEVYASQTVDGVTCVSPTSSVTVNENTTPPFADPGLGGVIDCSNSCVTLGGSGTSNTSTYAYSWTGPGFSSSEQFPEVCQPGTYSFFVIDLATSCVSTTVQAIVTGDNTLPVAMASASNDLDCNDLTATLNTTGSDPGTYTWAGPGSPTGSNPTVTMPGTYTLTVSSGNGCTSTQEVTITQDNAAPTASIAAPSSIDCNNSSVTLDGSGSSNGVTYMWSTGETTPTTTTNTGAGTYTLIVTNISNGCTDEVSVVVDDNSTVVTADVDVQGQITCTSGSVTLSAINVTGSSNPTFTWSNGMSGQTITVATAGSVTLTVTDATTGCTGDVVADVTSDNNTPMAVADVSGVLNCNNTSVVLSTAGSTTGGNITASWTAADPNNVMTPGMYTLTITNTDNGCTATADVNVIQDVTPPVASITAPTAIDCNNTNTTLDGSSSTGANLSYAWTGQAVGAGATLNATEAGTYTLTVTNMDNGCTDTEEVTVVDNTTTVTVSASVSNDLSCTETSATLDVSGGSGSSNPTYSWFDGTNTTTGSTLTTMNPGTYTLTLIDGTTGCQGSTEVIVDQDTNFPTATVAAPNNLTCITSSITLDGTSSTTGNDITYSWLFNGSPIPGTDPILSVTDAGNYQIVVTDAANGCEVTSSMIPVILDDSSPVASAVAGNNGIISCSATSLTIDGTASSTNSGNINYSWILNGTEVGTNDTYDVTSPGDYILEITDTDNGCTAQEMVTISPDADLPLLSIDPVVNLDCNNSSSTLIGNGSSNAGNTVTVEWQDASGATVSPTDEYTTTVPGDYTFIVIDNGNGCSLSQLVTVLENTDSPLIDVTPAPIIDCANTSVLVNASNSASGINISYQWQDALGNDLPSETNNTLTTGTAGDYIFVVTNTDNGCTSTQTVTVPENIEAPVFDASAMNNIDCNNMEAALTSSITSSFSTDLTYSWVLNGTTIGTMPTLSTANEGVITVLVTDNQNGCSSQMDVTVLNTTQDPTISAAASSNGALDCITIETTLDGTGSDTGTNFNYSWTLDTDPTNILSTDLMYTTENPGIYVLTVTNSDNGCVSTIPVTVTQSIAPPNSIATSNTATLTCSSPTITLDGTSSSIGANFTYQWYEVVGGTSTAITGATDISHDVGVEGTYELIVTNTDNGCTTVSSQITLNQSSDVPTAVISNDGILTCDNGDVLLDGLSSTGGTLTYEWIDANGTVTTGSELTVLIPGEVTLNITDTNNGCTSTDVFLVEEDVDAPVALAGTGGTLLCDQTILPLDGSASSQNGNFTYTWWTYVNGTPEVMVEPSAINYNATVAGDYVIIVTNTDNGCSTISAPVTVDQDINEPTVSMTPSNPILNCDIQTITFDASGSSVAMGSSGTLVYEWTDANGALLGNTATIDVSTTDEVFVTITDDANGCSVSESFSTTQDIEEPSADAGSTQTLTCGSSEVTLNGSNSSANGTITYSWYAPNDPNTVVATTATVDATMSGTWTLLITNTDNGCTSTSEVLVDQDINAPTAVVDFSGMLTCADTELTVDGSNSTIQSPNGTIEYLWENGATTETATFDAPGTYTVLITDNGNGCTAEQSFTIDQDIIEPVADIQALTSTTISCSEPSLVFNGSASNNNGNPNGGTLTYLWTLNNIPVTGGTTDQVEISEEGELVLEVFNSNNGCSSTFLMNIDVSDDVPQVDIPSATNSLNCDIDEVTIVATASTGNEFTYLWTGPGTIIGETTLTPTVSTTGIYTLTVTNTINDCDATATALIEGDFDAPNAFANATDQFDCVTDEVTLDGTGSATGPTISYSWTTVTGVIESGQNTFNPVVSAPGDYTLLVTDNENGCTSIAVVTVSANTDVPTIAGVQTINPNCFGENNGSITLDDVTGGQLPYLYSIDGGAFAPINQFSFLGAGQYDLVVQDANGCEASQQITITDPQELLVELGDNQTIGLGDEFQLSAQIVGAYDTIMWSANCPDSLCADQPEFSVSPLNTVSYFVTVVDGNGCITTDQITINVEKGREVFIPNAFNPNGSANPRFWVFAGQEAYKVHEFRVFNRWGEQVFAAFDYDPKSQDDTNGWDGTLDNKKMNPAVFVYYVDIEYIDGRREVLKGDVALRR